jgi:hypothetical protein
MVSPGGRGLGEGVRGGVRLAVGRKATGVAVVEGGNGRVVGVSGGPLASGVTRATGVCSTSAVAAGTAIAVGVLGRVGASVLAGGSVAVAVCVRTTFNGDGPVAWTASSQAPRT